MSSNVGVRSFRFFYEIPRSALAIADRYGRQSGSFELRFPDGDPELRHSWRLTLSDLTGVDPSGVPVHLGLRAQVDIHGEDLDAAEAQARARLDGILSMIAIQANASVGEIDLTLGYDTTPGSPSVEFMQVQRFEGQLLDRKRDLDAERVTQVIQHCLDSGDDNIGRAARWYRKGLIEDDSFDRFLHFWLGLENLNSRLARLLGGKPELRNCTNCGVAYEAPTAIGIKALFVQHSPGGFEDFKACRNLRVDLQHGLRPLSVIGRTVDECSELCRLALQLGLYLLIELTPGDARASPEPIFTLKAPWIEYRGIYESSSDDMSVVPELIFEPGTLEVWHEGDRRRMRLSRQIRSNVEAPGVMHGRMFVARGISVDEFELRGTPSTDPMTLQPVPEPEAN